MYMSVADSGLIRHALRWQRLVALLMVLVFVPSTVLAAMPLTWCIGADGHRAIEFAAGGAVKHDNHQALLHVEPASTASQSAGDSEDCRHWQLLEKTKVAQHDGQGLLTPDLRVAVALPALSLLQVVRTVLVSAPYRSDGGQPPDPHLTVLRSTVLRT